MNLLLILSAILSALTGVVSGTRGADAQQVVSHAAVTAVAATPARTAATCRPEQCRSAMTGIVIALPRAFALASAVPPYAGRRRE